MRLKCPYHIVVKNSGFGFVALIRWGDTMNRIHFYFIASLLTFSFLTSSTILGQSAVFQRGDANLDSKLDISDGAFTLLYLFTTGKQSNCHDAMDANDDGGLNIADASFILNYLFRNGSSPKAPGSECGADPTDDPLTCDQY